MKQKLINIFYLPILPIDILLALIFTIKEIKQIGFLEYLQTDNHDYEMEEFEKKHYHPILQKILAVIGWLVIIRFLYNFCN